MPRAATKYIGNEIIIQMVLKPKQQKVKGKNIKLNGVITNLIPGTTCRNGGLNTDIILRRFYR